MNKRMTVASGLITLIALTGCAFKQNVGPNGVEQEFGPFKQSVGPDGVKQEAGPWKQEADPDGVRQGYERD